ncbi:MAG: shikimate dehydrogenase [Gemmatimonadetes bacterium]|nr:shikimate dehydrogenase [Gemmatimonadota bacterium]
MPEITAATRLVALLGDPVAHSLSPRLQNAAFRAAGVDGVYVALRCDAEEAPTLLRAIARAGGAGNVTVPHKQLAARTIEVPTPAVERTGACNTFWLEGGRIHGDNTDVAGFVAAARALVGPLVGARVLLLGAGGAARAVLCALLDARADSVLVLNRSVARAEELRAAFDPSGRRVQVAADADVLRREGFDLVVNATSLGLHETDPAPVDLRRILRVGAVLDLVYAPGGTPWVRRARELGLTVADGLEMLLHQGAAAFERWWGRPAPTEAMRAALAEARVQLGS